MRSAAKKLVGPAPRPDQVQLAALQAVLDLAEQSLPERERDAVDAALAYARGALPAAAPLLDQGKCPTLPGTVFSFTSAMSNYYELFMLGAKREAMATDSSETDSMPPTNSGIYVFAAV